MDEEQGGENGGEGTGPSAEEVRQATAAGWAPKEKWRGNPDLWVDTKEFLRRRDEILPIVRADREKLQGKLDAAERRLAELATTVADQAKATKDLMDHQAGEIKRQVAAKIAELRMEKRAAIKEGDHDLAADLDEKIDEAKDDLAKASAAPPPPPPPPAPRLQVEQFAQEFAEENKDWLDVDKRKTRFFLATCEDIHVSTGLKGKDLLDEAKRQVEELLSPPSRSSKGEGGNGGWSGSNGGGSGGKGGKTFNDLPADAKAACLKDMPKFVGKLKDIKTDADWQKYYTKTYFESQS